MVMTVKAWDDTDDDTLMQELSEVLNNTKACFLLLAGPCTNSIKQPGACPLSTFFVFSFSICVIRKCSAYFTHEFSTF